MYLQFLVFSLVVNHAAQFPMADGEGNLTEVDNDYGDYGESFVRSSDQLWANGKIPYRYINNDTYYDFEKKLIRSQMDLIESQLPGCIQFIDIETSDQNFYPQELVIHKNDVLTCKATIGFREPRSNLNLGKPSCFVDEGPTILHELGHVLGMVHEQNRPDRDKYVTINFDLVDPNANKSMQIREEIFGETFETPYDFNSVMHYLRTQACIQNETICMEINWPYENMLSITDGTLNKYPNKLSPVDITEISRAYDCEISKEVEGQYNNYKKQILGRDLIVAANDGDYNLTKQLIEDGASVHEFDTNGMNGLMYAEKNDHLEVANLLLANGAIKEIAKCRKKWTVDHNTGSCYLFIQENMSWNAAKEKCNSLEAELLSIHSSLENDFIIDAFDSQVNDIFGYWMGGNNLAKNKEWMWTDGAPISFTYWSNGEPNGQDAKENCLMAWGKSEETTGLGEKFRWNDVICDDTYPLSTICKIPGANEIRETKKQITDEISVENGKFCGGDQWIYENKTGKCYQVLNTAMSWSEARRQCSSLPYKDGYESNLAIINSLEENDFIMSLLKQPFNWIGLSDIETENNFIWTDGFEAKQYANFVDGEPNNSDNVEDCVEIYQSSGKWNDADCSVTKYGVCQQTALDLPTVSQDGIVDNVQDNEWENCQNYTVLNERERASTYKTNGTFFCDHEDNGERGSWVGPSWYRMLPPAGTKLSTSPPGSAYCGTMFTGWSDDQLPAEPGETNNINICFSWSGNLCSKPISGKVTNCGDFFIYYLVDTPGCNYRYCAFD